MTDSRHVFKTGVERAAKGTPYIVTETRDGFDVSADVADEMWLNISSQQETEKLYIHKVRVQGNAYAILDDFQNLKWVDGTPIPGAVGSKTYSRFFSLKASSDYGPDVEAGAGGSEIGPWAGRRLITGVGDQLGLIRHNPANRIGLLLTGIAVLGTVIVMFSVAGWVLFGS